MEKFNHAFDVAFEVVSSREDASDVTPAMLSAALRKRADALDKSENDGAEWLEACGAPWDTHEEGGEE